MAATSCLGGKAVSAYDSGDALFRQRATPEQARLALDKYRELWRLHPDDFEAGWRVGMACQSVGYRLTPQEEEKQALFAEGKDASLRAAELRPDCGKCHFWTAINMALYGETVGVFKMLFTLGKVRQHLERALALDPTYAMAGPERILALIDWKLPGLVGGDDDRAKKRLASAIQRMPDEPINYWFFVQVVSSQDRAMAVEVARRGLQIPLPSPEQIESRESWLEMEEWLNSELQKANPNL